MYFFNCGFKFIWKIIYILIFLFLGVSFFYLGKFSVSLDSKNEILESREKMNRSMTRRAPSVKRKNHSVQQGALLNGGAFVGGEQQTLNDIIAKLLKRDTPIDWEKELQNIFSCSISSVNQTDALLVLFSQWAETDFPKAFEAASRIGDRLFRKEIVARFAERDPKEALKYAATHEYVLAEQYMSLINQATQVWAEKNPEEAMKWLLSPEAAYFYPYQMNDAFTNIMSEIGFRSPLTREYLDTIKARIGALPDEIIRSWAAEDPEAAQGWVDNKNNDSISNKWAFFTGLAINDPSKAAEMLANLPEKDRPNYISDMLKNIPDKETAFSSLLKIKPLSEITESDFLRITNWTLESPDEAKKWIQNLPSSEAKDMAVDFYVQGLGGGRVIGVEFLTGGISSRNPYEEAMLMVNGMDNQLRKEQVQRVLMESWQNADPAGFQDKAKQLDTGNIEKTE